MSHCSPSIVALAVVIAAGLAACAEQGKLPQEATIGPNPQLPSPDKSLVPTVKVAKAIGWPSESAKPTPAAGTDVKAFARGLDHPRWVYVLPNGDVLVAESAAPPKGEVKSETRSGIRGWFTKKALAKAGSAVPSANRITLLRDADGDGVAETRTVFLEKLFSPFGMVLVGQDLYVANADAVMRFPYTPGATKVEGPGTKVVDLPGGPLNHHWTKNIIASRDGRKLYATVGSNSNAAENGMEMEDGRAAIWEIDPRTGGHRIFASGLRNPNGMAWEPSTGALWTVVNERDELGNDLVPDYLTSVKDGGFYGWPYSYFGQTVDERVKPQKPELVSKAIKPDYSLGAHVAALGLTSSDGATMPQQFRNGMFIGMHGSWNRKPETGYKVVFVPFSGGRPSGMPVDVLTGFLDGDGNAMGRPVGVAVDKRGGLLVADDVGDTVWRVNSQTATAGR